ncbi:MAG: hypothetical protein ACM3IL_02485 [Deltaproteobacteria bacterium]
MKWMQNNIIGLDVDDGYAAASELGKKASRIALIRHAQASGLQELMRSPWLKEARLFIGIPAQIVLFRSFYITAALVKSKNKEKDIAAFLSRQSLPFKLEECYWDTFIWNNNLNFIAAKKEMVHRYLAQVEDLGLECCGVTVSLAALYDVLIHNYPEREKDRFAVLNIRTASSDLLIYEPKRIWIYPLSMGKKDFKNYSEALMKFPAEIQGIFNSHYLQNPQSNRQSPGYLYLSGLESSADLVSALKTAMTDFEVDLLEPLKKIALPGDRVNTPQAIALSVGLGISGFGSAAGLNINLIKAKIRSEKQTSRLYVLQKAAVAALLVFAALLSAADIGFLNKLNLYKRMNKDTELQISSTLPQIKALKDEEAKLKTLQAFLDSRVKQQMLYLKILATVSESKTSSVIIKEFSAERKGERLLTFISGTAPTYEEINNFLANLKKNPDIKDVKVMASTFPAGESENKAIDFKIGFEVQL